VGVGVAAAAITMGGAGDTTILLFLYLVQFWRIDNEWCLIDID